MRVRSPEWIDSQLSLLSALGRNGVARELYQLVVGIPRTHPPFPFQPHWSIIAAFNPSSVALMSLRPRVSRRCAPSGVYAGPGDRLRGELCLG